MSTYEICNIPCFGRYIGHQPVGTQNSQCRTWHCTQLMNSNRHAQKVSRRSQSRDASRDASRDVLCSIERHVSGRALESASSDDRSAFFLFGIACAHRWPRLTRIAARRARLRTLVGSISREGACSESQSLTSAQLACTH